MGDIEVSNPNAGNFFKHKINTLPNLSQTKTVWKHMKSFVQVWLLTPKTALCRGLVLDGIFKYKITANKLKLDETVLEELCVYLILPWSQKVYQLDF